MLKKNVLLAIFYFKPIHAEMKNLLLQEQPGHDWQQNKWTYAKHCFTNVLDHHAICLRDHPTTWIAFMHTLVLAILDLWKRIEQFQTEFPFL